MKLIKGCTYSDITKRLTWDDISQQLKDKIPEIRHQIDILKELRD